MVKKNYDDMLSRFHLIPERNWQTDGQTDRQTDGRTDRFAISMSRCWRAIKMEKWSGIRIRDRITTKS